MTFCSFCYSECASPVSCLQCNSTLYCTEECRALQWSHGHEQWCGIPHGKEGLDWEVVLISPEKGNGIVAKRRFERDERIMVERVYSTEEFDSHPFILPEIKKLAPSRTDDLSVKLQINSIGSCDDRGSFGGICIRMSRINHSCDPNAVTYYDDETRRQRGI
jgi:hypothetical protein